MDNFAYLKEISAANRPVQNQTGRSNLKISTVVKIAAGGMVLFFLIMAVGALMGNLGGKMDNLLKQLYVRTTNLNSVISDYNRDLKSSDLRSLGASLAGALTNATNQLTSVMVTEDGDEDEMMPDAATMEEESAVMNELSTSLTNAQLNGILDRTYANLVGLQVSLLLAMVTEAEARTDDTEILTVLTAYRENLETLHQRFEAYVDLGA